MFRKINISLCLLLFGVMLFAQKQGLDRSKAPKLQKPKEISFPKFKETILSNGLNLVVVENHNQPIVFATMAFRSGSYFDSEKPGLSSLVSELLTKGTSKRNALQIAREIDFLGAELNSGSGWDANRISIKLLKKNIDKGFEIFADCIVNPSFPDDELSREINQRMAELKHSKTEPNYLADVALSKVLYGSLPYSNPLSGNENSLKNITTDDLKKFYSKYFLPNNAYCVVSGDITLKEAVEVLESKLSGWKQGEVVKTDYQNFSVNNKRKVLVVDKKDAVQSAVRVGCVMFDRKNPDYFAVSVLNTYLGGYFRSQLNLNLREKNSFTYGASSGIDARMLPGPFAVRTQVGSEVTTPAVTEILNEIESLSKTPISNERFNEVKNFIIGSFPVGIQTNNQIAGAISTLKLYGLPMNYYDKYVSSIQKITKEDVMNAAKKYFDKNKLSIVISGDSKTISEGLKKFGEVEIVDVDGKPIK